METAELNEEATAEPDEQETAEFEEKMETAEPDEEVTAEFEEKCGEFCHMSSGWLDCTEPSLSTSLQGKQGVQGAYALVRGGSSTSNLVEPSRTTSLQR